MALNRRQRIRGATNVKRVYSGTRPIHHGGLSVRVVRVPGGASTFAVTVPVSVAAGAVRRNALRRRVTESLRLLLAKRPAADAMRVVITARRAEMSTAEIWESLVLLLEKSGILPQ